MSSKISIVSKVNPKKAPSFAQLAGHVFEDSEDDNFEIDEDQDIPQERGPEIDDQKDEQSEDQKIYGNFINEEALHKRSRFHAFSDESDSLNDSNASTELSSVFSSNYSSQETPKGTSNSGILPSYSSIRTHPLSEGGSISSDDTFTMSMEESDFSDLFVHDESNSIPKVFLNAPDQSSMTVSSFAIKKTSIIPPQKMKNSKFIRIKNGTYRVKESEDVELNGFKKSNFLDDSSDDELILSKNVKRGGNKGSKKGKELKSFGNCYFDDDVENQAFVPKKSKHKPEGRWTPKKKTF